MFSGRERGNIAPASKPWLVRTEPDTPKDGALVAGAMGELVAGAAGALAQQLECLAQLHGPNAFIDDERGGDGGLDRRAGLAGDDGERRVSFADGGPDEVVMVLAVFGVDDRELRGLTQDTFGGLAEGRVEFADEQTKVYERRHRLGSRRRPQVHNERRQPGPRGQGRIKGEVGLHNKVKVNEGLLRVCRGNVAASFRVWMRLNLRRQRNRVDDRSAMNHRASNVPIFESDERSTNEQASSELAFLVTGGSLLGELAGALLRKLYPQARVALDGPPIAGGVRIALRGSGRWLFLAGTDRPNGSLARAIAEGASAVVSIDANRETFQEAVEALVRGTEQRVPIEIVRQLAMASDATPLNPKLTLRELEIMGLVLDGYSNREIAAALTISTNTVRTHVHSLAVKLEAPGRAKLMAKARLLGLERSDGNDPRPFESRSA